MNVVLETCVAKAKITFVFFSHWLSIAADGLSVLKESICLVASALKVIHHKCFLYKVSNCKQKYSF